VTFREALVSIRVGWLVMVSCGLLIGCMESRDAPRTPDSTPATATPASSPASWQVRHDGIGPIRIGATVAELATALNTTLARADSLDARCDYVRALEILPGVWFMVVEGRLVRFDIDSAGPSTTDGVRVGDDTARVQQRYGPRVAVTPHKYTDGHYLTITPAAPADSGYRIIFEADSGRITRFRAGRLPEVGWVESCS
jgi:hypothetical protein